MEEIDRGSPLPKIIGGTPTATAMLAGLELKCLIDFGYMVTLISETFYKQKLESVCGGVKGGGKILMPCGANRLEIPYLGYQELDVHVEVVTVPKCRVLVFKDTAATVQQSKRRPKVLGMKVLAKISEWGELLKMEGSVSASSAQNKRPSKQGLVRAASTRAVWIPPHSAINVDVTGLVCGANTVVEPLLREDSELRLNWQMHPSHVSLSI